MRLAKYSRVDCAAEKAATVSARVAERPAYVADHDIDDEVFARARKQ